MTQRGTPRARSAANAPWLRLLFAVVPAYGNFPDFLTPAATGQDIDTALEQVLSTPRRILRRDLVNTFQRVRRLPAWATSLADGRATHLATLAGAMRRYYDVALAPYLATTVSHVELDRAERARRLMDTGVDGLLHGLNPSITWSGLALESDYPCYCAHGDPSAERHTLGLAGRGLTLVPTYFCWDTPVRTLDAGDDPVLVYPALPRAADAHEQRAARDPLAKLIGRSRTAVLRAISPAASTTDLARRMNITPAAVSQHISVLRDAGLVTTTRTGVSVRHTLTPLGRRLSNQ